MNDPYEIRKYPPFRASGRSISRWHQLRCFQDAKAFLAATSHSRSATGSSRIAAELLQKDPDNLLLLARTGQFVYSAALALDRHGIRRIEALRGYTVRDLLMIPNMGRVGAEQLVALAAERGIEINA